MGLWRDSESKMTVGVPGVTLFLGHYRYDPRIGCGQGTRVESESVSGEWVRTDLQTSEEWSSIAVQTVGPYGW